MRAKVTSQPSRVVGSGVGRGTRWTSKGVRPPDCNTCSPLSQSPLWMLIIKGFYLLILVGCREIPRIEMDWVDTFSSDGMMQSRSNPTSANHIKYCKKQLMIRTHALPNPPNSKAILPPGLRSQLISCTTPSGESLHQ